MSWQKVKLGQFLKNREGRYKPNDKAIQGLKRIDKINFAGTIFLSDKPSNTDMILVKKGDLVISGINVEKGAMNIYQGEEDVVATIHYSSYEFDEEKIDIDFLTNFLKSLEFKKALKEQVPGGIKTEIKPKHILPLIVEIPTDVKEQKRIVKKLIENNSIIENITSELIYQLDLIKQLRQAFLREAMEGKLVKSTNTAATGKQLLEKIKTEKAQLIAEKKLKKEKELPAITDDEIPFEIPGHWAWCRLGEICTLITDGKHGDCKNELNSGYYFLSAKDIQNGQFIYDGARQITYDDFLETHRRTNLEPGDLCIVNTGATIGKSAFAPEDEKTKNTTFQKSVAVIKVLKEYTNMRFVENFIINETPRLLKKSRGSAINNLLLGDMRNTLFPLPPLHEQEQIVAKLEELMAFCDGLENSIKESQGYNEMLLQEVLREALQGGRRN
ncbi:restriction endonuclease subunit S [Flavobacterium sp.]|jgi:type I restriction enzyme S subunit|uniref:restriction endonuclease subunit S n=1 Tax=Flavobacterium sp. TaxID=239 RepID=UPI0037C143E9